jgi:hypothetical protein
MNSSARILLYALRVLAAFLGGLVTYVAVFAVASRFFDCTSPDCFPSGVGLILRLWFSFGVFGVWRLTSPLTQSKVQHVPPDDSALRLEEELYGTDKVVRPPRTRRLGATMIVLGALPLPLMFMSACSVVRCGHAWILVVLGAFCALSGGLLIAASSAIERDAPVAPAVSFLRWPVVFIGMWLMIVAILVIIANGQQVLVLNAVSTLLAGASGITAFAQISATRKPAGPSLADRA